MITLNTDRKDWREHLDKIVRLGDAGARVLYWEGTTDWDPRGERKDVFGVIMEYSERGMVHLCQGRVDGGYQYIAEVR